MTTTTPMPAHSELERELIKMLKDAPEPYEYMRRQDFTDLPYPMRSFVDAHKTWISKVRSVLDLAAARAGSEG